MNQRNYSPDEEDTSIDSCSYLNLSYISINYENLFKEKRNTNYNNFETNENIIFKLAYNKVFNLRNEETIIDNENMNHLLIKTEGVKPNKPSINKKKRGRKITNNNDNKRKRDPHDKFVNDNVIKKIQIHYMNFIINFINDCISYKEKSYQFKYFIHKVKSDSSKKHIKELENSSINYLLKNIPISSKFKCSENRNKNLVDKLLKNEEDNFFKEIFGMKYLELFDYYFNNNEPSEEIIINNNKIKLSSDTNIFYELIQNNKDMKERILQIVEKIYNKKLVKENSMNYEE